MITFIDPPGPLTDTSEVIDFTATELVVSVSIEFNPQLGNGLRETVWDGPDGDGVGDFSYLYRTSTKSGSGPYTWSIRRQGKWPAEFRIRVQEVAPGEAQMLTAVYDLISGANNNVVLTPSVDQCSGLVFHVVEGSSFNGLTAPSDTTQPHLLTVFNDSAFSVGLVHESSGSAAANRFYINTETSLTLSAYQTAQFIWIPASLSIRGLSRWYYYQGV